MKKPANPLEHWSASRRRALVGLLALGLLVIPASRVIEADLAAMFRTRSESAVLTPAWDILQAVRMVQRHRGLANAELSGGQSLAAERTQARDDMQAALQRARGSIARLDSAVEQRRLQQIAQAAAELAAAVDSRQLDADESFRRHTGLITRALDLVDEIAASSAIGVYSDRGSSFLQAAVLRHLPGATESLARIRGEGARLLTLRRISAAERLSLAAELGRAEREFREAWDALARSGLATPGSALADPVQAAALAATDAAALARRDLLLAEQPRAPADEYFAAMTGAIDRQYALIGVAFEQLRTRLQSARAQARQRLVMECGGILLLALFSSWLLLLAGRAQRRQEASDARSRAIIDAAPDAVFVCDRDGRITSFNPAAERLLGGVTIGAPVAAAFTGSDAAQIEAELQSLFRSPGPSRGVTREATGRRTDGTEFNGELICYGVGHGAQRQNIAVVRDISERRRLEKQLRQGQKLEAVGQLTGGIAHDFNNLLGVILGNLDLAERQVAALPAVAKRLQTAQKAALRGADLTRRLLAFSRRQHLEPARVRLADAIENVVEMASRTLGPDIRIATSVAADTPDVIADAAALENALLNLLVNARDAMPQGGEIRIDAAEIEVDAHHPAVKSADLVPGRYTSLRVTDSGHGIPADQLEKVFEPFFSTKAPGKGTGLGLAMVYGFAKQSGGHVKIYSEVNVGTTIAIVLPMADRDAAAPAAPAADTQSCRVLPGATALVVDDEPDLKEVAAAYLKDMGFNVLTACDGPDALRVLESGPAIDLLITDVLMPGGMNGVVLSQRVRERLPDVRVVYTSGFPADALAQRDQTRVVGPLVNKPFQRREFARAVGHAMEGEAA